MPISSNRIWKRIAEKMIQCILLIPCHQGSGILYK
jgi:hypothetical protein